MRIKLTKITNSCGDWLIIELSIKFLRVSSERKPNLGFGLGLRDFTISSVHFVETQAL